MRLCSHSNLSKIRNSHFSTWFFRTSGKLRLNVEQVSQSFRKIPTDAMFWQVYFELQGNFLQTTVKFSSKFRKVLFELYEFFLKFREVPSNFRKPSPSEKFSLHFREVLLRNSHKLQQNTSENQGREVSFREVFPPPPFLRSSSLEKLSQTSGKFPQNF